MENHELRGEVIKDMAAFNRARDEAEAQKIVFSQGVSLHTPETVARFLGKLNLIPPSLEAAAQENGAVLPNLISAGFRLSVQQLDEAMKNTNLETDARFRIKSRLSAIGII